MRRALTMISTRIKGFLACERGNVVAMFAAAAFPLAVAAGIGIDAAKVYSVKVRLGAALDAAALAVGSSNPAQFTNAQLQQRMQNYFYANFPVNSPIGTPTAPVMTVDPNNSHLINFTTTATVDTVFMRLVGINNLTMTVTNQVTRGITGLELALVLDNTGSMLCGDGSGCSTPSHISALITDANSIIDALFSASADPSRLKIAIVPYVTTVNIGTACGNTLTKGSPCVPLPYKDIYGNVIKDFNNNPITFDPTQTENTAEWRGCVIEPTSTPPNPPANTTEDTGNSGPDFTEPGGGWTQSWTAFYWKPNTKSAGTNDWNLTTKPIQYLHQAGNVGNSWSNSKGPNNGCPTPLVRLTNDQTALHNSINGLKAWAAGGTQIHIGMIWGWRVLSPNAPFSDGSAYNTPNWVKAVVLETDGQNEIPDANHLTGLSFIADGKFGSKTIGNTNNPALGTALYNMNQRLQKVCANMKAQKIVVYTIGLGNGSDTTTQSGQALLNCATDPSHFYAAPTAASLQTAFNAIANSLASLYLSK